jgi:hypothetical protein
MPLAVLEINEELRGENEKAARRALHVCTWYGRIAVLPQHYRSVYGLQPLLQAAMIMSGLIPSRRGWRGGVLLDPTARFRPGSPRR